MKTLIASDRYPDIRYGFKLSYSNIGHEDLIYTFPYFCAFLLKRFMSDFRPEEERDILHQFFSFKLCSPSYVVQVKHAYQYGKYECRDYRILCGQ